MTTMSDGKDEYMIVSDDSGHWYVIRADQEKDFIKWVELTSDWQETDLDFEPNRLSGSPSNIRFKEWRAR